MRDFAALLRFIAERRDAPFVWGSDKNDCVSFAGQAAKATTGRNPFDDLSWGDEDEAYRVIESVGGLATGVSARLSEIVPAMAHRGDLAGVMLDNHLFLMVVMGDHLVGPGPERQRRLPRKMMVQAWSID